jgi:hypothetical protein
MGASRETTIAVARIGRENTDYEYVIEVMPVGPG